MTASPVDWTTAARIARRLARRDPLERSYLRHSLEPDFERVTVEAEALVADFTGLVPPTHARAAVVDRAAWIDANIVSMRRLLSAINPALTARFDGGPIGAVGRHAAGSELGVILGYMSQRVLGQYDLLMPDDAEGSSTPGARSANDSVSRDGSEGDTVFYVGTNVLTLEKRFGFRPVEFRRWIAIHELTHRAQFTAVPWLRGYFLGLVDEMLGRVEPDPRALVRAFARAAEAVSRGKHPFDEAGIVGLFADDHQRALLGRIQAFMSLLEGHGNYVMNVLGREHVHGVERMERVLTARRAQGGVSGQLNKVLGLEMKLRQYEIGERFIEAVVERAGFEALDVAFSEPDALPHLDEFTDADRWLARMAGTRVSA